MTNSYPIMEFDKDRTSITMPDPFRIGAGTPIPARGVLCFFLDVFEELKREGVLTHLGDLGSEMGKNPVYRYQIGADALTVFHPGLGAPLAAGYLEELIAVGVTMFMVCGGCGVLDVTIDAGHPVILTSAVRDEGTSYHYLPPAREVQPHPLAITALKEACLEERIDYRLGKTWTTDAFYRETPGKRKTRLAEGCDVVEMEAAAFFAVAQFREVKLGQIVYGGDLVHEDGWDLRAWRDKSDVRRQLFNLAVKAVLKL